MREPQPSLDVDDLYRRFGPMVYRRCLFVLRNEEAALDTAQEVFLQLWRHRNRLTAQGPSSLLYTIATRLSLNALRRRGWEDLPPDVALRDRSEDLTLGTLVLDRVFRDEKPDTRVMAVLHWVDGMTLEETARTVGLSVSGVRKRLSKLQTSARRLAGGEHG